MIMIYHFYVIRHKATGLIMPQAKRDRGYSNWNPAVKDNDFYQALPIPRLIDTRRRAANCIKNWASCPNGKRWSGQDSYTGEWEEVVDVKDDGRKSTDLEIVEVELSVKSNGEEKH